MKPRRLLAVLLALATQLPAPAFGQTDADKATARELAKEGAEALDKKSFELAADRFARADALFHAPTLVLGLARARVGLGQLVSAQENYYDILREPLPPNPPEAFVQAMADAKKELAVLSPQVPWVIVKLAGITDAKDAKVTLDGLPVPTAAIGVKRAVDPGDHKLRVSAKGFKVVEKAFTIAAGATQTVEITLEVAPPEPAKPIVAPPVDDGASGGFFPHQKAVAIATLAVGAAGLGAGVATGVLAIGKKKDLEALGCTTDTGCPASAVYSGELDTYRTFANISTGTLIGGGVLAAAGVILLVTASKGSKSEPAAKPGSGAWVMPVVGLGAIGLIGKF